MSDFSAKWTCDRIVSNDDGEQMNDATGKAIFAPPSNALHLVGKDNTYGQYSKGLYGNVEGDFDHSGVGERKEDHSRGEGEAKETEESLLKNGQYVTEQTDTLEAELDVWAQHAKVDSAVPSDEPRKRTLISAKFTDYKGYDIVSWFPDRVSKKYDPAIILTCWKGADCMWKDPAKANDKRPEIKQHKVKHRRAEGISLPAYVVYPEYYCTKCGSSKSAMDPEAMAAMGVPIFVLNQCPVVSLEKSALTKELFELILTLMPSELGAAQIRTLCRKTRAALYAHDVRTYSEYHAYLVHQRENRLGLGLGLGLG
jgi:hypothetical protein